MDIRGFDGAHADTGRDPTDSGVGETTIAIGSDERRMHVRAYNQWVSLLKGRDYPSVEDLDPSGNADFGAHGVLLDFTDGVENPIIRFLGRALREECSLDHRITRIADVPARSLLSRLTDHYLQIIANRAPIGFEAEFVGTRGHYTMYRGILMPFSSDSSTIDFVYGVINWKELVGEEEQAKLTAELTAAVQAAPAPAAKLAAPVAVWADGPSASFAPLASQGSLADRLADAREGAASAQAADRRSRCALYRALGQAYDFVLAATLDPGGADMLLAEAGLRREAPASLTPLVKAVFGTGYDQASLTEFATMLSEAASAGVGTGGLKAFLEEHPAALRGGALSRAMRLKQSVPPPGFRDRAAVATLKLTVPAKAGEMVVLVARAGKDGTLDVLGVVGNDQELTTRAVMALD